MVYEIPYFQDVGVDDSVLRWREHMNVFEASDDEEAIRQVEKDVAKRGTVEIAYLPNKTELGVRPISLTRVVKQW